MLSNLRESEELRKTGTDCLIYGMKFKIRRIDYGFHDHLVDAKRHLFGVNYIEEMLTENEKMEAMALTIAEYLVVGWEGVKEDESGEDIPFTKANSKSVFCNPEMWYSLNTLILAHAGSFENYLKEKLKKDIESAKK